MGWILSLVGVLVHAVVVQCKGEESWINGKSFGELLSTLVNEKGLGHSHLQVRLESGTKHWKGVYKGYKNSPHVCNKHVIKHDL